LREECPGFWQAFYVLLELAFECDDEGRIYLTPDRPYSLKQLANELGISPKKTEILLNSLQNLEILTKNGDGILMLTSYSERQYESDISTATTRKYREKLRETSLRERSQNVPETAMERCGNGPETETETEQTRKASAFVAEAAAPSGNKLPPEAEDSVSVVQDGGNGGKPKKPGLGPASLMQLWNDLGCRPLVSELTDERRKKAGLRIRKRGDPDWWNRLFEKVKGLNKPWLTFDFLMRSDTNCLKVLEGNYDHDFGDRNNGRQTRAGAPGQQTPRGYDQRPDQYVFEVPDPSPLMTSITTSN